MYYALKSDCYFRLCGDLGYISRPIISIEEVVDECGAAFLKQLKYEPQCVDDIIGRLSEEFVGVDMGQLKQDAIEFYDGLVADGFLNKSESLDEYEEAGFDYMTLPGKMGSNSLKPQLEESSVHFLGRFFMEHPFLDTFHIELTAKCNERCIHCYIPHEEKNTEIEPALMYDVLRQCKEMGVLSVIFSGGEPMLHPNFCQFLRFAKDLDFNVVVLSNLAMLNEEIVAALKYRHASCVNVSLYSMDPTVHDGITTIAGSWEKTKNNILYLIEHNVPVQINCPIMKQNKDSFYDVIRWGQGHKCSVNTDYLIMARSDRSCDNLDNRLTAGDMEDVIRNLLENDVVFRDKLRNNDDIADKAVLPRGDERVCGVGMSTLCMVAGGAVYPCAGWQSQYCGDLTKQRLKDIWENSPQVKYLRGLRQKDFVQCSGCEDYDYCLMCMGRNSNEDVNGDIFSIPGITCEAALIHRKVVEEFLQSNLAEKK